MKIYIIKHKGANTFGNFCARYHRAKYGETYVLRGSFYQRLKDAKLSLKHTTNNPENHEILSLEISKPKTKYAKCIRTYFSPLLELGKKYKILADHKNNICIIDEAGNLSTFNKCYFEL
jgi:hypothetical protein